MNRVDSFLEGLQRDGDFESIGRFTLDPAKAREKLQKFQLVEPHAYPVHLVAAAVASGATRIDLQVDADDLRLDFDGRAFPAEEMENLFASLFASERHPGLIRLQELAIGLNAALVARPRSIDVESWNETGGIHLRLSPDRERLERVRPGPPGDLSTRIHVRQRLGLKTVLRFLSKRTPPEESAVRQRCGLCPVPLRLNGELLSSPLVVPPCLVLTHLRGGPHELALESPEAAVQFEEESPGDYSAWLALGPPPGLHWVVNGVSHTESFGSAAWVVSGSLPKDVSQTSLVQGEEWQRITSQLLEAHERQLQALARAYAELEPLLQAEARPLLVRRLADGLQLGQPVPPELAPLVEAPLFLLAHGKPVSLAALIEQSQRLGWDHCLSTEGRWPCPPLDGTLVVYLDRETRSCVERAFPRWIPSDHKLAEAQLAQDKQRAFEREIPGELQFERGTTVFLEETFAGPDFHGVLGLTTRSADCARMRIYKGGRELVARKLYERWPLGLAVLADHPDVVPNPSWTGVLDHDPALRTLEEAVRRALPRLYARAAEMAENADGLLREQAEQALIAFLVYCVQQQQDPGPTARLPLLSGYTYAELAEQYQVLGHLPVSDRYADVKPLREVKIVRLQPCLQELFPTLAPYDAELKAAKLHYDNLARWESSPKVPVRVPEATFLARLSLPEARGELALPAGPPHNTVQLYFFRQERSLGKRYFSGTPVPGGLPAGMQVALQDDAFPCDPHWAGSSDGPVLEAALGGLGPFIDQLFALLGESFPEFEPARRWAQGFLGSYLSWAPAQPDPALLEALALDGVGTRRHSLKAVVEAVAAQGSVGAVRGERPLAELSGLAEPFLRLSEELWSALERWLGPGTIRDGTDDYLRAANASSFWERPVEEPRLPEGMLLRVPLAEGELGLTADEPGLAPLHLNVRILHQGRLLTEWRLPLGPLAGVPQVSFGRWRALGVVEAGSAVPNVDWDDLRAGPETDELTGLLRAAGRRLFLALAERLPSLDSPDEALAWLWAQLKADTALDEARREMTRVPVFPLLGGGWASLGDLRREVDKSERVGYLVGTSDGPAGEVPIVLVRRELLPLLRALLGVQHTYDATVAVNAMGRASAHRRAAPVEQLQLPEHPYLAVGVLGGEREGRVGLSPVLGGSSRVQLLLERRPLDERRLQLPYTLEAIVNDNQLRPNRDFTAVAEGPELTRLLQAVVEAGNQLVLGQALSWTGDPTGQRQQLREFLICVTCRVPPESPLARDLLDLPLFLSAMLDRVSLAQLRRAPRVLTLPADLPAEPRPEEVLPEGSLALLLTPLEEEALRGVVTLTNYRAGYEAAVTFYRTRPDEGMLRLPRGDYLSDFELALPLRGHVGWLRSGPLCTLELYWRGRDVQRLHTRQFPAWQAVVDDHRLEFCAQGPRPAPEALFAEVERQLWAHIEERMLRTDWLPAEERRRLWLQLGTSKEWLLNGPILPSSGPLRSLKEVRERRLPYVLRGQPVPSGPAVLILSEEEAERVQAALGPLPCASEVARPGLPPCLVTLRHDEGGLDVELGIAVDPGRAGIALRGVGQVDLFAGPGFVGWAEGPWSDVTGARRVLFRFPDELLRELCQGQPENPATLRALAAWPPFHRRGPHLPDWLLGAPLFPLKGGGRTSLEELESRGLEYGAQGKLELEPDSPAFRWLEVLFGAAPRVVTPLEQLSAELGRELEGLSDVPFRLEFWEGPAQLLFEFDFNALTLDVNRAHPLVQQILAGRSAARYILLSAIASQVFRLKGAQQRVAERRFHQELLLRLTPV